MTIKQLLIGTLVGATALGTMIHRMPKKQVLSEKTPVRHVAQAKAKHKVESRLSHRTTSHKTGTRLSHRPHRKAAPEVQLSLSKVFE